MKLIVKTFTSYQDLLFALGMAHKAIPEQTDAWRCSLRNNAPQNISQGILDNTYKLISVQKEIINFLVYYILPTFPNIDAGYDWWLGIGAYTGESQEELHKAWMDMCLYEAFND